MNRDMVRGVAIGLGVGLLAPTVFPPLARVMKPTLRAVVRAGVVAWDRGRERLAEIGEYAEDMAAEVRAQSGSGDGNIPPAPPASDMEGGRA